MTAQPLEAGKRNSIGDGPSPDPKPPLGCGTSDGADGACSEGDDLPAGWRSTTLGDVITHKPGKYLKKDLYAGGGPFMVYGSNSVMGSHREFLYQGPLVVMAGVGAYAGAVRLSRQPCWVNNNAFAIFARESVDAGWLYYWLDSVLDLDQVRQGAAQPYVNKAALRDHPIAVPPVEEQRRIVDVVEEHLSRLDAAEARLQSGKTKLGQLKRSILHRALTAGDGWRSTTLGEVADVVSGGTPSTKVPEFWSGDIVWVTPSEVVGSESGVIVDSQRKVTQEGLDRSSARILPVDAVLLTSRATIGAVALAGVPLATNQGFASLVCGERLLPRFAMFWCLANTGQLMARASGTTFLEISRKKVAAIPIALPPVEEQRRIVEVVEEQLPQVDRMEQAVDSGIARAASLRRSILAAALSGRLTSKELAA